LPVSMSFTEPPKTGESDKKKICEATNRGKKTQPQKGRIQKEEKIKKGGGGKPESGDHSKVLGPEKLKGALEKRVRMHGSTEKKIC